ncbi:SCO family protein [Melghirimyces algeriensis]|uniref:Protein SCO1/2 n=1 Tax=Melghirimyces algeriensis TaxID=910412 RepID=A0A521DL21_9BACL|nr:SCO family protein [Melghirimyces algeriensis]SMO72328.1 protein SCO1/2 [Melghirimyces algeriensis]
MIGFSRGKILTIVAATALLMVYGGLDWGNKPLHPHPDSIGVNSAPIPEFTYIDQNGVSFGTEDLKGSIWLADIIYTRCPDVASPMTANKVRLQKRLQKENLDVKLVSFSADPLFDSPSRLRQYGNHLHVDFSNWHFLTHNSEPQLHRFLKAAFGDPVQREGFPSEESPPQISHSTRFYLIDQDGKVMSHYNGLQPDYDQIIRDIRTLQR